MTEDTDPEGESPKMELVLIRQDGFTMIWGLRFPESRSYVWDDMNQK